MIEWIVNVIVVVGSEKLHVEMTKLMSTNRSVMVVRVPKSGGVSLLSDLSLITVLTLSHRYLIWTYHINGETIAGKFTLTFMADQLIQWAN